MRVLDLFSGIGGFSLGLDRAGMETIAFCEIDPNCQAVLKAHWPTVHIFHDVEYLQAAQGTEEGHFTLESPGSEFRVVSKIDVIAGGYPCTGHSVAGNKKGFENEHSALWTHYHRLAKHIKPKYCIIENSPNLRSTGLAELLKAFDEIGYNAEWAIISGYSVGAPHQRERLYLVFWRQDLSYPDPFRSWHPDPAKEEGTLGWWAKRRIKRSPVHIQAAKASSGFLFDIDGLSQKFLKRQEYKVAMLGNAVIPQIPELIGRALILHNQGL
jgi:DNA (cytosine-5)-methyltransferase 1